MCESYGWDRFKKSDPFLISMIENVCNFIGKKITRKNTPIFLIKFLMMLHFIPRKLKLLEIRAKKTERKLLLQ